MQGLTYEGRIITSDDVIYVARGAHSSSYGWRRSQMASEPPHRSPNFITMYGGRDYPTDAIIQFTTSPFGHYRFYDAVSDINISEVCDGASPCRHQVVLTQGGFATEKFLSGDVIWYILQRLRRHDAHFAQYNAVVVVTP